MLKKREEWGQGEAREDGNGNGNGNGNGEGRNGRWALQHFEVAEEDFGMVVVVVIAAAAAIAGVADLEVLLVEIVAPRAWGCWVENYDSLEAGGWVGKEERRQQGEVGFFVNEVSIHIFRIPSYIDYGLDTHFL